MGLTPPKELIKFLKPYDPEIRKLALGVRALVLDVMAPCYESIYDAYSAVAMGYGPTGRMSDGICHVAVYPSGVNLGFNFGALMSDPEGILEGTGKQIRHIKFSSVEDLERPEVKEYLRRACRMAEEDARKLGEKITRPAKVVSVVKAIYPRKRRPDASGKTVIVTNEGTQKQQRRKRK
jgi:hypothetical protein